MDYEKRYKKALERAKDYHKQLLNEDNPELAGEIEDIFPELKESKDDRIRRTLIRYHQSTLNIDGVKGKEILAWLEKQDNKEPKKVSIWKHWKDGIAGNAEGEQIFLTKIGRVYSIT